MIVGSLLQEQTKKLVCEEKPVSHVDEAVVLAIKLDDVVVFIPQMIHLYVFEYVCV